MHKQLHVRRTACKRGSCAARRPGPRLVPLHRQPAGLHLGANTGRTAAPPPNLPTLAHVVRGAVREVSRVDGALVSLHTNKDAAAGCSVMSIASAAARTGCSSPALEQWPATPVSCSVAVRLTRMMPTGEPSSDRMLQSSPILADCLGSFTMLTNRVGGKSAGWEWDCVGCR